LEKLPTFVKPYKIKKEVEADYNAWERAIKAYDNKEYKKSVIEVLKYINKRLLKGQNSKKDIYIKTAQGFVEIEIKINNTQLEIYAKVAKITKDTNKIALLRTMAKSNFSDYDLTPLTLNNDLIEIKYKEPLELCKPIKIYRVIKDIVHIGEENSYKFIEKFNAQMVNSALKQELSKKEKEITTSQIELYLSEFNEFKNYFKNNALEDYIWDLSLITLYKISILPNLNGAIKFEIYDEIGNLLNRDIDFIERRDRGERFISELKKETLINSLYKVNFTASLLTDGNEMILKEYIEGYLENLSKMRADSNYLAVAYYGETILLRLLYLYDIDDDYKEYIYKTLTKASRKEVNKTAKNIYNTIMQIYNQQVVNNDKVLLYILAFMGLYWIAYFIKRYFLNG